MPRSTALRKRAATAIAKFIGMPATLVVLKPAGPEAIPIQFNPSEYHITTRSTYSERERVRKDDPVVSFGGNPMSTLTVRLYFNDDEPTSIQGAVGAVKDLITGTEKDGIAKKISKIVELTKIDGESHQPPNAAFVWGSTQFVGFVQNVTTAYTMFDKSGKPLRATVDLTMMGFTQIADERASPLMSPDRTKAKTMTEDSSLFSIAEKEYGDAREWRRIADANDIMNPLDIPVGRVLKVPSIND
jgi:hypothetical protein